MSRRRDDRGSMTVLTTGVLVVILLVMAVGTAITSVHLDRNRLQSIADGAALAGSQALDVAALYDEDAAVVGAHPTPDRARAAVRDYLRHYPLRSSRLRDTHLEEVRVAPDGTVTVRIGALTDPALAGWFTRGTRTSIPLVTEGSARAR